MKVGDVITEKVQEKLKRWFYFKATRMLYKFFVLLYKPYSLLKSESANLGYWDPGVVSPTLAEMFNREIPLTGSAKVAQAAFEETTTLQGVSDGK
jgi:hypothetical protein